MAMSLPQTPAFEQERAERYNISLDMVPSSRFLTPPSPYSMDARRDSIASSQSSMSSFASCMSEYSGPVTPNCDQSPTNEEDFVGGLAYDLGQNFRNPTMHGLPLSQPPKVFESDQSFYSSWQIIAPTATFGESQSTQFPPQLVMPAAGDFPQPHTIENTGLDVEMVPTMDSSWSLFSSVVTPDMTQHWGSRTLDHIIPDDTPQNFWVPQMQQAQATMHAMTPSAAMVDVDSGCIHVRPESFTDSDSFVHVTSAFAQSPQEVSFKKESSPMLKQESDGEDVSTRLTRSIYVSPTGGKSVKKERRSRVTRKRSKAAKHNEGFTEIDDKKVAAMLDGIGLSKDDVKLFQDGFALLENEEMGECEFVLTEAKSAKLRCTRMDKRTGVRCSSRFIRQEHLKRHEKTHNGKCEFVCRSCGRPFNRHDNLQAHILTHLRLPGRKEGRNTKMTMAEIIKKHCSDPVTGPKLMDKLRQKWKTEVGDEFIEDLIA